MKQNLANSIILPPKNGGLKAWSHSVRKPNSVLHDNENCEGLSLCYQTQFSVLVDKPRPLYRYRAVAKTFFQTSFVSSQFQINQFETKPDKT